MSINIVNNNLFKRIGQRLIPNSWAKAALVVGAVAGVIYLKNKLLISSKSVQFSDENKLYLIEPYKEEAFPQGYAINRPGEVGPEVVVVSMVTAHEVWLRFQSDKETIDPGDYKFVSSETFKSWSPSRLW